MNRARGKIVAHRSASTPTCRVTVPLASHCLMRLMAHLPFAGGSVLPADAQVRLRAPVAPCVRSLPASMPLARRSTMMPPGPSATAPRQAAPRPGSVDVAIAAESPAVAAAEHVRRGAPLRIQGREVVLPFLVRETDVRLDRGDGARPVPGQLRMARPTQELRRITAMRPPALLLPAAEPRCALGNLDDD